VLAFVGIIFFFTIASPVSNRGQSRKHWASDGARIDRRRRHDIRHCVWEFDLSVGSTLALAGVVSAMAMRGIARMARGRSSSFWYCVLIGLVKRRAHTRFRIPSFLIHLGSLRYRRGIAFSLPIRVGHHRQQVVFRRFRRGAPTGISGPIIWTGVIIAIGITLLHSLSSGARFSQPAAMQRSARYSGSASPRSRF